GRAITGWTDQRRPQDSVAGLGKSRKRAEAKIGRGRLSLPAGAAEQFVNHVSQLLRRSSGCRVQTAWDDRLSGPNEVTVQSRAQAQSIELNQKRRPFGHGQSLELKNAIAGIGRIDIYVPQCEICFQEILVRDKVEHLGERADQAERFIPSEQSTRAQKILKRKASNPFA